MVSWIDADSFEIEGTQFVCCPALRGGFQSAPRRFCLVKPRSAVEAYERLLDSAAPKNIVEVGVFDGASSAFIAELARPRKLVGIDLAKPTSDALVEFIERRHLDDVVSMHFNVDQADASQLESIVAAEFGEEDLDLVIDDASHLLDATRRTFNALFPRLRPGATYIIEDWWWANTYKSEVIWPDEAPLSSMVFELVLAGAYEPEIVANVTTNRNWALVTRGDAVIHAETFELSQCYGPRGRALMA